MLCINGLVTVLVLQLMGDIGRQRHLAQLVQNLLKNTLVGETESDGFPPLPRQ